MTSYIKVRALNEDGWSDWIQPVREGYKMSCCDCGLVHTMDFRVFNGRAQFRAARNNRSTALVRRHRKAQGKSIPVDNAQGS